GLTFAFREAVFALAAIEQEWLGRRRGVRLSDIRSVLEDVMLAHPEGWRRYYEGDEERKRFARAFSWSDRIRYYLPRPEGEAPLQHLPPSPAAVATPPPLLSQYLPGPWGALLSAGNEATPRSLVHEKIRETTSLYARACGRTRRA